MTRVGIITQARTTSTRLPEKVLLEAAGRTMLDHHLDRLEEAGLEVLVATTVNAADDRIADLAARRSILATRGSEEDVLARYAGAAEEAALDVVVRVTSDCPLIDARVIQRGVERYLELDDPYAYVSNTIDRTFPRGFDFEIFSAQALFEADAEASDPAEREHVTPYLYANRSGRVTLHPIRRHSDASRYRVTLDTREDLVLLRALIEEHGAQDLDAEAIIGILNAHPQLASLNAHVEQKKLGD